MKILFLTKEFPYPVNSGARMRTAHYLNGLARAGEVRMVCGGIEGDRHFPDAGTEKVGKVPVTIYSGEDVDRKITITERLKALFSGLPCAVAARVSSRMKESAREAVRAFQCDLIVCDGIHMALNVPMEIPGRKILDEHNVESTIIGRYVNVARNPLAKAYALIEWLKFRRFEERVWKQFDEIHVCSEADKIQVEKRCGHQHVRVVPNGVTIEAPRHYDTKALKSKDIEASRHGDPKTSGGASAIVSECAVSLSGDKPFRLVYSGLMGWHPNNDAALYFAREIYPLIKDAQARVQFVIVGKDPSAEVQALAQKDTSITVTGFVDEVKPLIQSADVFVVPLRIGSGTRLKILEAMALGRAVVSTSIGCEGLQVTHGEDILIADTPKGFAECVARLLEDEALRQRIAASGCRLVHEKYDWEKIEADLAREIGNFRAHEHMT